MNPTNCLSLEGRSFMFVKSVVAGAMLAATMAGSAWAAECKLSADGERGKAAASACKGCHELEPGKASRPTGPNLATVFGNKAGGVGDFTKYSEAMQAAGAKLTWDEASLMSYVADPKTFLASVNGKEMKHGMFFALKDEAKRKDIVVFLKEIAACK
jgi:cytochrome c2